MAKEVLTNHQKRCEDCAYLTKKNGEWCCEECFGQPVSDIDDCPEGYTLEEVEESQAKTIKLKLGARQEDIKPDSEKPKKKVTKKVPPQKQALYDLIYNAITSEYGENTVEIVTNGKLMLAKVNEMTISIDLVEKGKYKKNKK